MNADRNDPVLGALRFDDRLNWYEGAYQLRDDFRIRFYVSLDSTGGVESALSDARDLLPTLLAVIDDCKSFASNRLLQIKNDGWLEEGEAPLSGEAFVASLELESIVFFAERECEFYFTDGNLFWGHTILVSWNPEQGFHDVDVAG